MNKKIIFYIFITCLILPLSLLGQGVNNTWLLGNHPGWPNIGRFVFDINSYQLLTEQRKMAFKGTQATISDEQGNFLMSSNGVWIANANNDTMMNGAGLNPGPFVNSWSAGLPIINGNIFLPYPSDTNKYILFHQTGEPNLNGLSIDILYTIVDISLDIGLGGVINKNAAFLSDTISWGFALCKHANGRDWWIIVSKDSTDLFYKVLLTPNGIESITSQNLNFIPIPHEAISQHTFAQDGSKFITTTYDDPVSRNSSLIIADFDRCSGTFSNTQVLQLTSGSYLWGLAFSPSGEFVYACNSVNIFQINTTTLTVDTVAIYDGFISGFPPNCCATTFSSMYLAANGKIYITSGSSVQHLHEMNYPDSAGVACDVQQHNIALGNYFHLRAVPNHPNYYLGALTGSPCDTLTSSVELPEHDFRFSVSPNPNNGNFKIMYLLPQNKNGLLEIFDVTGKKVYVQKLPPWSTMQHLSLPQLSNGVYHCAINSGGERVNRRIVIFNE